MRLSTNVNNNIGFNGQATNVTVTLIIVQSVTTLATKVPAFRTHVTTVGTTVGGRTEHLASFLDV